MSNLKDSRKQSLVDALNERDRGMSQQDKRRRARGIIVASSATAAIAGTIVAAAPNSDSSNPKNEGPKVICEVPVRAGDTPSGLAGDFHVGTSDVRIYAPQQTHPEAHPENTMQPGDIAVARVGELVCKQLGGMPGDPEHPNVIVE